MFRGGRMTFAPEHQVEGNGWIVASWPSSLEKAYWADPAVQKREMPDTWPAQMQSQGESWTRGRPRLDPDPPRAASSTRCARASPPSRTAAPGHHAAAVAHMVNESIKRKAPVSWDFEKDVLKKA